MKARKQKIAIIGTAGVPSRYGGFETLAHNLAQELNQEFDIHIYASTKLYKKEERVKYWNNCRIHYLPFSANGVSSVIYDMISIFHAIFYAKTLIILGVSGGLFIPIVRLFTRRKVIVNIDGLEWRRDKWSKWAKKFLKFSERMAVRFSHADITDNLSIKRYTATYYKTCSHLIAYGADHCHKVTLSSEDHKNYPFLSSPYAFKVARIEPENNIEMVLNAFRFDGKKKLVVVGNWQNSEYGQHLYEIYNIERNIHLLDPIYDQIELDKLRSNAYVYIHGHSAGGTNPSLVEAMYLGLPVLAFDVSFNRDTTNNNSFFFKNEEELVELLNKLRLNDLLVSANKLKDYANIHYNWHQISQLYKSLILSFENGYQKHTTRELGKTNEKYAIKGYAHLNYVKPFYK